MNPSLQQVGTAFRRVSQASRSSIALVWLLSGVLDLVLIRALMGAGSTELWLGASDVFRPSDIDWSGAAVLGLIASSAFKRGLYAPLRRVLDSEAPPNVLETVTLAAWFTLPAYLVQQVIGILVSVVAVLGLVLGSQVSLIPQMLAYAVLTPAVYLVVNGRAGILGSLRMALRWSRGREVLLMGVQTASVAAAMFLNLLLAAQFGGDLSLTHVGAATVYLMLGWCAWQAEASTYVAIEEVEV